MLAAPITALTAVVVPMTVAPSMIGAAKAATCPPAEVVFARGRMEPPGPGQVGAAFVNALRALRGPNISLYPVNYPADTQVDMGANDMSRHIQWMTRNCPNTRLVLGGYSLGAAATDLVLAMPISAFTFNSPRFIAFLGPLFAGMLIAQFGGFSGMAVAFSFIYILGFVLVPFLPETKGKPLPA